MDKGSYEYRKNLLQKMFGKPMIKENYIWKVWDIM